MELDEMKQAWAEMSLRQDGMEALLRADFHDRGMDKLRRRLRPLVIGQTLQLLLGVALSVWGAAFWTTHLHPRHLLVCGLLVHAYGILLIVLAANDLYLVRRIDNAAPLLEVQRRLAKLRRFRVHMEGPVHAVLGWFVWIPVTLMALAGAGIDLWSRGIVAWALVCSVFGLTAVGLAVWLMRRRGWTRKFEDNSAGRSVLHAEALLDEIARFERE